MTCRQPLFASRLDPEHYQAIRAYAAKQPENTLREIMQDMIEQYLKSKGQWVDTQADTTVDTDLSVRLRGGRRRKGKLLEDAVVIIDDDNIRHSA